MSRQQPWLAKQGLCVHHCSETFGKVCVSWGWSLSTAHRTLSLQSHIPKFPLQWSCFERKSIIFYKTCIVQWESTWQHLHLLCGLFIFLFSAMIQLWVSQKLILQHWLVTKYELDKSVIYFHGVLRSGNVRILFFPSVEEEWKHGRGGDFYFYFLLTF